MYEVEKPRYGREVGRLQGLNVIQKQLRISAEETDSSTAVEHDRLQTTHVVFTVDLRTGRPFSKSPTKVMEAFLTINYLVFLQYINVHVLVTIS